MARYGFRIRATHGNDPRPPNIPIFGDQRVWIPNNAWLYVNIVKAVNTVGFFEGIIQIDGKSPGLNDIFDVQPVAGQPDTSKLDWLLEVFRQPSSFNGRTSTMTLYATFLIRYTRTEQLNDGRPRVTVIGRELTDLLDRTLIYPDVVTVPEVVTTQPGSEAAATLVWNATPWVPTAQENFTGAAVGDTKEQMEECVQQCSLSVPALFDPIFLTTPVPAAGGGIVDHPISYRNKKLLSALQELSSASWYAWFWGLDDGAGNPAGLPVDFDVVVDPVNPNVQTLPLQFQTFVGGRGTDRRLGNPGGLNPVILSSNYDNVTLPVSISDRRSEITRVIVGGEGTGVDRESIIVQNDIHSSAPHSPFNIVEKFVGANNIPAFPAGITEAVKAGWAVLRSGGYRQDMTLKPRQNGSGYIFGIDYFLGDLVNIFFIGEQQDRQVQKVDIKLFNHPANKTGGSIGSHEQVTVELGTLDGRKTDGLKNFQRIFEILAERQEQLEEQITDDNASV